LGGWCYTIHLSQLQQARGSAVVLPVEPHDSNSYANLSESLLAGYFAEPGEAYEYFHTPGYPAFVAAILFITGGSFFAVTFVQLFLVFAVALMTYVLGRALISERVGLWASLLFLVNPLVPFISLIVLTDILFTFLLTLSFTILVTQFDKRPAFATLCAALVFAAAVYVRPVGFIAFPIFIAFMFMGAAPFKKTLAYAALMLAIIGVLLVPWMLRNRAHSGVLSFSSLFSLNMAYYEIPHYLAWHNNMTIADGIKKVETDSGVPQGTDANGYPANWYDLTYTPQLDRYIYKTILANPVSYAFWHIYNSSGFFLNPGVNPLGGRTVNLKKLLAQGQILTLLKEAATPWWLFVERILIFVGLALIAVAVWRLRRKLFVWLFLFIILYFAVLGGPSATSRLRLPVEPLLSILMAAGLSALYTIVVKKQNEK
jgi:4-amino-4-deoxy-L-arabinose transferase-like glycosyltransferase